MYYFFKDYIYKINYKLVILNKLQIFFYLRYLLLKLVRNKHNKHFCIKSIKHKIHWTTKFNAVS